MTETGVIWGGFLDGVDMRESRRMSRSPSEGRAWEGGGQGGLLLEGVISCLASKVPRNAALTRGHQVAMQASDRSIPSLGSRASGPCKQGRHTATQIASGVTSDSSLASGLLMRHPAWGTGRGGAGEAPHLFLVQDENRHPHLGDPCPPPLTSSPGCPKPPSYLPWEHC